MIETDFHTLKGGDRYSDILDKAVIYSLVNLDNGKRYIGRTRNPKHRIYQHLCELRGHRHKNKVLNKDSNCRFGFEILEEDVLYINETERELHYMIVFKTYDERYGYNGNDQAVRSNKTHDFTSNFKRLIEEINAESDT